MGRFCDCPQEAALADISVSDCAEAMGQLQKAAFQRVKNDAGGKNAIADPRLLASWSPLLTAVDSTKVVMSPYLQAPTSEAGAPRTFGGGNETLNGIEVITGSESSSFTAVIYDAAQITAKQMKKLACENVGVWLFDEFNNIGCLVDDRAAPTEFYPIPIKAFFVSDKGFGNLENPDTNKVQWKMLPNWSDNFVIVKPTDFEPLFDLVGPTSGGAFDAGFNEDFG